MQNEESNYFNFSVSFRIMDVPQYHDQIEEVTGLKATHAHCKGESRDKHNRIKWDNDIWILESQLKKDSNFNKHIEWIYNQIFPHVRYFRALQKKNANIDLYCGYRSDCDNGGFTLTPESIKYIGKLNFPIGFSIVIS